MMNFITHFLRQNRKWARHTHQNLCHASKHWVDEPSSTRIWKRFGHLSCYGNQRNYKISYRRWTLMKSWHFSQWSRVVWRLYQYQRSLLWQYSASRHTTNKNLRQQHRCSYKRGLNNMWVWPDGSSAKVRSVPEFCILDDDPSSILWLGSPIFCVLRIPTPHRYHKQLLFSVCDSERGKKFITW